MVGATLTVRRWGPAAGGWIVGLPLTSGPIAFFFALEHGPVFAARAAVSTLLGINAVAATVVTYALLARSWQWITQISRPQMTPINADRLCIVSTSELL